MIHILIGLTVIVFAIIELKYGWYGKPVFLYYLQPTVYRLKMFTLQYRIDEILNISYEKQKILRIKIDKEKKLIYFRGKYLYPFLGAGPFIGTMTLKDNGNNTTAATTVAKTLFTLSLAVVMMLADIFISDWNNKKNIIDNFYLLFLYTYKGIFFLVMYCFMELSLFKINVNRVALFINNEVKCSGAQQIVEKQID